ncbi:MAG: LamG-like jellyroll fold domain-containing protein, partial [Candidatus Micrarchaeaceae archaeon]
KQERGHKAFDKRNMAHSLSDIRNEAINHVHMPYANAGHKNCWDFLKLIQQKLIKFFLNIISECMAVRYSKFCIKGALTKAQSAMEYLMTYGWAILVIAVVLGALYSLGVFNANNFAPKAPPGSCQVFRPNGPGTTSFMSLEGVCNGELPEYTMQITEPASGGSNAYINVINNNNPLLTFTPTNNFTISAWVNVISERSGYVNDLWDIGFGSYCYGVIRDNSGPIQMVRGGNQEMYFWGNIGQWYNYVGVYTYNGVAGNVYLYANGQYVGGGPAGSCTATTGNFIIGEVANIGALNITDYANIQLYNTSLSASEIQALYTEGIGGAPIDLQNLVGWWPLNGNANDYSGNGNNGQATGVTYVSNWYSGYTPP